MTSLTGLDFEGASERRVILDFGGQTFWQGRSLLAERATGGTLRNRKERTASVTKTQFRREGIIEICFAGRF